VAVYEIGEFTKCGDPPQRVTVVTPDEIDKFLGARSRIERTDHLRQLRDRRMLITDKGNTLQQQVKGVPGRCAYVFVGPASKVPKIGKGRLPTGVLTWR
jgi:hypothetical protein